MNQDIDEIPTQDADSRYENYSGYNRMVRNWFVAFGVGAPILFATNDHLNDVLSKSKHEIAIIMLYLGGVAVQVFSAFINKWSSWHIYYGEYKPSYQHTIRYRCWSAVNDMSDLDFFFDLASLALFSFATIWVVKLF